MCTFSLYLTFSHQVSSFTLLVMPTEAIHSRVPIGTNLREIQGSLVQRVSPRIHMTLRQGKRLRNFFKSKRRYTHAHKLIHSIQLSPFISKYTNIKHDRVNKQIHRLIFHTHLHAHTLPGMYTHTHIYIYISIDTQYRRHCVGGNGKQTNKKPR